jgi:hypothetical protein
MTFDLRSRDGVRAGVTAAAEAAAATLPLPAVVEAPLEEQTPTGLLPDGGSGRAVVLNVRGGVTGTLVLVLADSLAQALENSPFGAQQLLDALGPALTDAGTALEQGGGVQVEAATRCSPGSPCRGSVTGGPSPPCRCSAAASTSRRSPLLLDAAAAPEQADGVQVPEQRDASEAQTLEYQALQGLEGAAAAVPPGASRPLTLLHDVEMGVTRRARPHAHDRPGPAVADPRRRRRARPRCRQPGRRARQRHPHRPRRGRRHRRGVRHPHLRDRRQPPAEPTRRR